MLAELRKSAGNVVAKVILALLVISFGAWGIGDMIKFRAGDKPVAKVGDVKFDRYDLDTEFRREVARLNPRFGNRLTLDTARALGIPQAVLGRMINEALINTEAQDLKVAISDDIVRDEVHASPAFRSQLGTGGFDRNRFQVVLQQNGLTEKEYLRQLRAEIARAQYLDSVEAGVKAPTVLADAIYRYEQEKRVGETLKILDSAMPAPAQPDDAAMRKYHKDNAARFTAPEYRAITLLMIRAADLVDPAAVTDDELHKAFEDRAASLSVPERRTLSQIILQTKDAAEKAHAALVQGQDFDAVAKQFADMAPDATDLGTVTQQDVIAEIADAAFKAPEGGVSAPVKGPGGFGWYLIKVRKVEAGHDATFDEAKDKLRTTLAKEKALDALYSLANKIEDDIGGGRTLEETAQDLSLKTVRIPAVDKGGRGADGKPAAGLPANAGPIAASAFETEELAVSTLQELGNEAFFILRVDKITPPALRPFETVKTDIAQAMAAEARRDAAHQAAMTVQARLKNGESLETLAQEYGALIGQTKALTRSGRPDRQDLPPQIAGDLFALASGAGEAAITRAADGYVVSRVMRVIPADPVADKDGHQATVQALTQDMKDDLIAQLTTNLREDIGVTINEAAVRQVLDPSSAQN